MNPVVLSIDIGTSSLKAALIDGEGRDRAFVRAAYPAEGGRSAAGWEAALGRALAVLVREAPESRPAALCVSGNGPTLVPVTAGGEALAPLHWYDGRLIPAAALGPSEAARHQLSLFLPRAAWLREKEPGIYEGARYLFSSQEWLSWRLGAEGVTVFPAEAYRPYYWDEEGCRFFGVEMAKFPPPVKLGTLIGGVSAAALGRLGGFAGGDFSLWLSPGTPIVAGGPDFIAALIGTGVLESGRALDRAGSSEGINLCVASPPVQRPPAFRFLPGAQEGLWNVGAVIPSSGRLFEWYRGVTGQRGRPYEEILAEIAAIPPAPGAPFFFPDPSGWGGRYGDGDLPGRAELGRAVAEALGFLSAEAMDALEREGFTLGELRLSGGQCKSPRWNRLKADITGRVFLEPEIPDGELVGDAAAAFFALGEFSSLKEAAARMVRVKGRREGDPARAALYAERRARYRELAGRQG